MTASRRAAAVTVRDLLRASREVLHLRRFRDNLTAAHGLMGRDDEQACVFLEDALADLQVVLGETAPGAERRPSVAVRR